MQSIGSAGPPETKFEAMVRAWAARLLACCTPARCTRSVHKTRGSDSAGCPVAPHRMPHGIVSLVSLVRVQAVFAAHSFSPGQNKMFYSVGTLHACTTCTVAGLGQIRTYTGLLLSVLNTYSYYYGRSSNVLEGKIGWEFGLAPRHVPSRSRIKHAQRARHPIIDQTWCNPRNPSAADAAKIKERAP